LEDVRPAVKQEISMPTNTTTYSLQKPVVGGDEDAWGGYINSNLDTIDDLLDGTTPVTGIDINSGSIDNTPIGATTASTGNFSTLSIGSTAITATAAELNILDGVTATAADLNTTDVTTLGTVEASKVVTADANGDVTFPDDDKIVLGNSSDFQIYHAAGGASIIEETGGGDMILRGTNLRLRDADNNDYIVMLDNGTGGTVLIKHNSVTKLETTSTGIDVTGELIADSYNETYAAVTSSSNATTVDCEAGNAFSHTLTENTTFTFSNPPASGTAYSFSIEIIQDASASGFTVTWPSSVDWPSATAPTLTATASAKDVFIFTTRDAGVTWYGFTAGQALG
jgi:hypothetical protein